MTYMCIVKAASPLCSSFINTSMHVTMCWIIVVSHCQLSKLFVLESPGGGAVE